MNHNLWASVGARVLALTFVLAGLSACGDRPNTSTRSAATPDPSAVVIGTAPAQPTGDPPGTTAVSPGATDVSKAVESQSMPLPGQPNDHSNVAPKPSQAPAGADALKSPEAAKQANAGEKTERHQ
jgi:hypothetical protein